MSTPETAPRRPVYLLVVTVVVALEALSLAVWAVLEFISAGGSDAAGSAVALGVFFLVCAVGLGACARGLLMLDSWSRAPVVLAQLVVLGLAWNARHTATALAVVLAVAAAVGLVGIFHPRSLDALAASEDDEQ